MEKWYLLYCKRDQVLRAIEHLERQGVSAHNPTYKTEKMVRSRRKTVMEPLFPNYLFVKFDYEVIHFVRFGQNPVVVPNEVIATLVVPDFVKEMSDNLPQKGDEVVITDGIFAGIQAIYNEPDGEARSVLLLNILNREVPKVVDNRSFETIK